MDDSRDPPNEEGEDPLERLEIPKPEPAPGVTAPLDDVTEAEKEMEPVGVMPGAGPDEEPGPSDRTEGEGRIPTGRDATPGEPDEAPPPEDSQP
jgi:hypothetical protein